ncbi:MAG: class I SAM-dependent methyltransferase [Myxococcota bacterium]
MPSLRPEELEEISRETIGHYDEHAESFWQGTRDHDVSQNIAALLAAIDAPPPLRILDFGCGPGRDLMDFSQRGHTPTGLDGSARFCQMARQNAGCPVWHQDFLALRLPDAYFDGVFANATLFHIPSQEMPRVLGELRATLRPGGVLFSSVPRGPQIEGWNGSRYGTYHELPSWTQMMEAAGFEPLGHYYRPPGRPREEQPWLASTWRRSRSSG